MVSEKDKHLIDAMMLLEIAFMGGSDDWKKDKVFNGLDHDEMACFAHSLIQFALNGYRHQGYMAAIDLIARIQADCAVKDAIERAKGGNARP